MAFIPVSNAAEITMQFSQADGSFAENVFWVQRTIAWDATSLTTMADAFITWFGTGDGTYNYKGLMGTNCALNAVVARDNTTQTSDVVTSNTGLPIAGFETPPTIDLGLTFVLTARTGKAGRSYRGRTYLVGLTENQWTSAELNEYSPTAAAHAVDAFNALITAVTAADADSTLVVCSRYSGVDPTTGKPIPRASGITTPILTYGFHNLLTDFQRRRAPAHNRHH
jgi:hypothetical protein